MRQRHRWPALLVVAALATFLGCSRLPRAATDAQKRELCLANVRSLSMSMLLYAQDCGGKLPLADWSDSAEGYIRNRQILQCPADNASLSYALRSAAQGKALSAFTTPTQDILLYESDDGWTLVARHNGESVLSYVDGHAKAMLKSNVVLQPGMR